MTSRARRTDSLGLRRLVGPALCLVIGCTDPPPNRLAQDPNVPLEEAIAACGTLADVRERGRCTFGALKVRDAISLENCSNIPGHGLRGQGLGVDGRTLVDRGLGLGTEWHDECLFEVASRSTKPLAARYRMCRESGSFARVCGYHLWQSPLNALRVGQPGAEAEAIVKASALFVKHKPHAQRLDRNFTETFWTWFWGSWWTHQDVTDADDLSPCLQWPGPADQAACRTWAPAALEWINDRKMNQPR